MKNLIAILLIACGGCVSTQQVMAQTVCGPYAPFARVINPDGSETVRAYASCQNPDPANWSHTYTLEFPSILTYYNGTTLVFVGNAVAYVYGHHDCVSSGRAGGRCGVRWVTVDSASLTDPTGASLPIVKSEVGTITYPVDLWSSQVPLSPDTVYSFAVSGTNNVPTAPGITDTLEIQATYNICTATSPPPCPAPPPPCTDCGD